MVTVRMLVYRQWSENEPAASVSLERHQERARLVRALLDSFLIQPISVGELDDHRPHEVVEVIVALGSAGVFTALVKAFQVWLDRDKLRDVDITIDGVGHIKARSATAADLEKLIRAAGMRE